MKNEKLCHHVSEQNLNEETKTANHQTEKFIEHEMNY